MKAKLERAASPFWIGVDGGGTRSRAVVGDGDGRVLGAAVGGPGLIDPSDPQRAADAVAATVREAAVEARATLPARGLWAGLAGSGHLRARAEAETALHHAGLATRTRVDGDVEAAHADAFGDGPGVLLVVGTGSALRAVEPDGGVVAVGGWGHLVSDDGSGYAIGLAGLRAAARACDGREQPTSLRSAVLAAVGGSGAAPGWEPRDLAAWAVAATKREIAALSVQVTEEATRGDAVAARIVRGAVKDIRAHLEAVLGRSGGWGGAPPLALVGGLVEPGRPLRAAVEDAAAALGFAVHRRPVTPARGALLNAIRMTS